jgi:hypothetical protein
MKVQSATIIIPRVIIHVKEMKADSVKKALPIIRVGSVVQQ